MLILYLHQVNRRKREARESALPTNFEQSKEKNYPPTSLVTLLCIFCVLGRAHSCALCAPSGRRGESRRAGDGNPALLLLCSNWPQQPAAASRSDFLVPKGNAIKKFKILSHYYLYSRKQERRLLLPLFLLLVPPAGNFLQPPTWSTWNKRASHHKIPLLTTKPPPRTMTRLLITCSSSSFSSRIRSPA